MVKVYKELKASGLKSKMILQVHDELVFDVLKGEEDANESFGEIIAMERAIEMSGSHGGRNGNWRQLVSSSLSVNNYITNNKIKQLKR